jgi:hypothetical protein
MRFQKSDSIAKNSLELSVNINQIYSFRSKILPQSATAFQTANCSCSLPAAILAKQPCIC